MIDYRIDESRIKIGHERIKKAYRMEYPAEIPIIDVAPPVNNYTIRQIALDEDCMLRRQLDKITRTSYLDTDYAPYLEPWICVPILAEPFGAEIQFMDHEWPASRPIIFDDPEDVYKLKYPKPWESPLWKQLRKTIDHFQRETDGRIPVATTDPQGPFTTASLLWETTEFFMACYTNPDEVHHIMRLLTDQFIEYYEAQLKVIENPAYPGHNFPLGEAGRGISISDDNIVMISPQIFEEFNLPYLSEISEHFGGLYYHSCGKYDHMIESILKIPKLRAINWHTGPYEMGSVPLEKVWGKCAIWTGPSHNETGWHGEMPPYDEMIENFYIPQNMAWGGRGVIMTGFGGYQGNPDITAAQQQLKMAKFRAIIDRYERR